MEHIIWKYIIGHLKKQHILTVLQHGLNSCETQLIETLQDLCNLEMKNPSWHGNPGLLIIIYNDNYKQICD